MSIRQLRARIARDDAGLGLVEVIAAFTIFAIIAVGMAYSMATMTRLTSDSSHRETASNLAAAEIDRVQSQKDAFKVYGGTTTTTIDGVAYTVDTSVGWVSANGGTASCGTGGGTLQYKRVNVTVTWAGMYLTNPVRADSALAPTSRINDPAYGTILVSVIDVDGIGAPGIAVTATKTSGGAGISGSIDPTDADGCTYVLKVPPGDYNLTISKTGYVDTKHQSSTTSPIQVAAGNATSVPLQYDQAGTFTMKYAANSPKPVKLPTNLTVTYSGQLTELTETAAGTRALFPWPKGYQAIAGMPSACAAVDPDNWAANATKQDAVRAGAVAVTPGASGNLPVPMGVVDVKVPGVGLLGNSDPYITAVAQNAPGDGNPGCAAATAVGGYKLTFAQFTKNSTQTFALPYGTWILYAGTTAGSTTTPIAANITVVGGVVTIVDGVAGGLLTNVLGGGTVAGSVITLDPRQAKP